MDGTPSEQALARLVHHCTLEVDEALAFKHILIALGSKEVAEVYGRSHASSAMLKLRKAVSVSLALNVVRLLDEGTDAKSMARAVSMLRSTPTLQEDVVARLLSRSPPGEPAAEIKQVLDGWRSLGREHKHVIAGLRAARNDHLAHALDKIELQHPNYKNLLDLLDAVAHLVHQMAGICGILLNDFNAAGNLWSKRAHCLSQALVVGGQQLSDNVEWRGARRGAITPMDILRPGQRRTPS